MSMVEIAKEIGCSRNTIWKWFQHFCFSSTRIINNQNSCFFIYF
ncbi:MAG: helix-turn-helix domain-containing protein [Actinobacteria bacterium]|nr:helix-turn-helix domain-containing protein [Actinomycetota bacterium]MBL7124286.1 helix-turn-helix domain-containing protein [Actinomycetota bacterium]